MEERDGWGLGGIKRKVAQRGTGAEGWDRGAWGGSCALICSVGHRKGVQGRGEMTMLRKRGGSPFKSMVCVVKGEGSGLEAGVKTTC
jgi:hypothetical protein